MPKAGKKHFPYTKAGKKRAQKYAKKHGLKVKGSKNPGHYAEGAISMNKELYKRIGRLYEKEEHAVPDDELQRDAAPFLKRAEEEKRKAEEKAAKEKAAKEKRNNESVWTTYKDIALLFLGEGREGQPAPGKGPGGAIFRRRRSGEIPYSKRMPGMSPKGVGVAGERMHGADVTPGSRGDRDELQKRLEAAKKSGALEAYRKERAAKDPQAQSQSRA